MTTVLSATCYRFADLVVASDRPLPELPLADHAAAADVAVTWQGPPLPDAAGWFQTWTAGDGHVRFGRSHGNYLLDFPEWARVLITPDAGRVVIEQPDDVTPFQIRHLLLHQVMPLVLSRRGRFVVHCSAVSWRGRVIGFAGQTGAGKSTLAAACVLQGASIVADDSLVLARTAIGWTAVPSYPGLRVRRDAFELLAWGDAQWSRAPDAADKVLLTGCRGESAFETRVLPLDRLFLVSVETGTGGVREVRGSAAAVALASHLFRLDVEDAAESRRLFDDVVAVTAEVPIAALDVAGNAADLARLARGLLDAM